MTMQTPILLEDARFTVYSPRCIRIEYAWNGQFSPYPSLLTGNDTVDPIEVDAEVKSNALHICTDAFELLYKKNDEVFSPENLKIIHKDHTGNKQVWVPGKRDAGNLGTVRRCLDQWQWCGGPEHNPVEGILSTQGGHMVLDEPRVYWNEKYNWPECYGNRVAFDGYFFAYGSDYKAALQDFVRVFGRIPMIPRWAFGFWYSRWYAYTHQDLLDLAEKYHNEEIPIDVMVIDTDWRDGWGGYDWTEKYFPQPEKTFAELRKIGIHTGVNDHPGYGNYDTLPAGDSHIPKIEKRLGPLPHQGEWACDWSNKKAVQTWRDVVLGPFFDQGMDFWWIDGWIKSPFGGTDSQLWANRQYFELCMEKTGKRGLILSRWGGIGSHRYPVGFSGDTASEWGVLKHQIEFTARSGNLGAIYWSHDIGGFFGKKIDEELFIRWSQFGAMSPIFRTHSDHGIREPWKYSTTAKQLFKKQTRIRYALAPYFYTLAREAHDTGLPIIRPLYLEYSENDGGALWRKHQYTIGRDMLVIPADEPADKNTGVLRKRVYFPKGRWFEMETGEIIQGTQDSWIEIPLERIPTFVHEGAIIPCQPVGDSLAHTTADVMHFDYYPDPMNASMYELYEDDGETCDYLKGKCSRLTVRGSRWDGHIDFVIGAPEGSYRGMPKKRTYTVRTRIEDGDEVQGVQLKKGRAAWTDAEFSMTSICLAGTVESSHRFCETTVTTSNTAVQIRISL